MASEVSHRHTATAASLYFTIRNTSRQYWNGTGWESCAAASWGTYDIAMAESGSGTYFYEGTFPAIAGNMTAGWYWVDVFSGSSPAISDTLLASYFGYWDGTTYSWWSNNALGTGATFTAIPWNAAWDAEVQSECVDAITAELNSIADAILKRDWSSVTGEAARSVLNALRAIRNKVAESSGTLTVYKEDDATSAWTAAVTTDNAAQPIIAIDPA